MSHHILVVEDNVSLAVGLRHSLESEGHRVAVVHDGADALQRILRQPRPDLVVLDLMLPGMDGFSVLRRVRDAGLAIPVLVLSARGEDVDKIQGFRFGADDYVVKPVGLIELLLRVRAILRRSGAGSGDGSSLHLLGDVRVDVAARTVERRGEPVELTRLEFDLLACLLRRRGRAVHRETLLAEVWGYPDPARVRTRTLDTHVASLRAKLEVDPATPVRIVTVRKVGYRLES